MAQASLKQVNRLLELIVESGWTREELQRRIIERWGLLRDIAVALDYPQLSEEQVRAMHPLFYRKGEVPELPTEITVGGRVYEILSFLREGDKGYIRDDEMRSRAKEMRANLGREDGEFISDHKGEIPVALRGKVVFVFPEWQCPGMTTQVMYLFWHSRSGWSGVWRERNRGDWFGECRRFLRRKAA